MQIISEGSVRVDLLGGTLDLEPINLILPNVVTLNVATSLKAKVTVESTQEETVVIKSEDYNTTYTFQKSDFTSQKLIQEGFFKEMSFICQILDAFNLHSNISLTLKSGAPAGSGLGGSSAMGITLFKALCKYTNKELKVDEAVAVVKGIEGRILNQGVPGYQDYYPALLGGILCLRGVPGKTIYQQLYSDELKSFLEDHITLVYSGISRQSGINNWDVYKAFFDGNEKVRSGMYEIANLSYRAYEAIEEMNFSELLQLMGQEGNAREMLAKGIVPTEIKEFYQALSKEVPGVGLKMCGAGGGGCFIITHQKNQKEQVLQSVKSFNSNPKMKVLDFSIESPLQ